MRRLIKFELAFLRDVQLQSSGLTPCDFQSIQYMADEISTISSIEELLHSENGLFDQVLLNSSSIVGLDSNLGSILQTGSQIISGDKNLPVNKVIDAATSAFSGIGGIFGSISDGSWIQFLEDSAIGDVTATILDLVNLSDNLGKNKLDGDILGTLLKGSELGESYSQKTVIKDIENEYFPVTSSSSTSLDEILTFLSSKDLSLSDKLFYLLDGSAEAEILESFSILYSKLSTFISMSTNLENYNLDFDPIFDDLFFYDTSNLSCETKNEISEILKNLAKIENLVKITPKTVLSRAFNNVLDQLLSLDRSLEREDYDLGVNFSKLEMDVAQFSNYFKSLQISAIDKILKMSIQTIDKMDQESCMSVMAVYNKIVEDFYTALNGYKFKKILSSDIISQTKDIELSDYHEIGQITTRIKRQANELLPNLDDTETLELFTKTILGVAQINWDNLNNAEKEIFTTQISLIFDSLSGIFKVTAQASSLDFSNFKNLIDQSPLGDIYISIEQMIRSISTLDKYFSKSAETNNYNFSKITPEIAKIRQQFIEIITAFIEILGRPTPLLEDIIEDLSDFDIENLIQAGIELQLDPKNPNNAKNFVIELLPNLGFPEEVAVKIGQNVEYGYEAMVRFLDELKYFEDESPVVEVLFYLPNMASELLQEVDSSTVKTLFDSLIKSIYDFEGGVRSGTILSQLGDAALEGIFTHMRVNGVEINNFKERISNLTTVFMEYSQGKITVDDLLLELVENTGFEAIYKDTLTQVKKIEGAFQLLVGQSVESIFDTYIPEWRDANYEERQVLAKDLPDAIGGTFNNYKNKISNLISESLNIIFVIWEDVDDLLGATFINPYYEDYWAEIIENINSVDDFIKFLQLAADDMNLNWVDTSVVSTWVNYLSGFTDKTLYTSFETMKMLSEIVIYEEANRDKSVFEQVEIIFQDNHIGLFLLRIDSLANSAPGTAPGKVVENYVQLVEDVIQVGVSPFFGFWKSMQTSVYQNCSEGQDKFLKIYDTGYRSVEFFNKWMEIWAKNQENYDLNEDIYQFSEMDSFVSIFENAITSYQNADKLVPLFLDASETIRFISRELYYDEYFNAANIYDLITSTLYLPIDVIVDIYSFALEMANIFITDGQQADADYIIEALNAIFGNDNNINTLKRIAKVGDILVQVFSNPNYQWGIEEAWNKDVKNFTDIARRDGKDFEDIFIDYKTILYYYWDDAFLETAGCTFEKLPFFVLKSTDKMLEEFSQSINYRFNEQTVSSCLSNYNPELCWTHFAIKIKDGQSYITMTDYNNRILNTELYTYPMRFLNGTSDYPYFDLILANPMKEVGLESTTKLFITYVEYIGQLEVTISGVLTSNYAEIFKQLGFGLEAAAMKISNDTVTLMRENYYFFQRYLDAEEIFEIIKSTNILQEDTIGLIVYAAEQVYEVYLDVKEAISYYSKNPVTANAILETIFEFYDDSILQYVVNGIVENGLLGNFKNVMVETMNAIKGAELSVTKLIDDFANYKSNIQNAINIPEMVHHTVRELVKFNETFEGMAENVRRESLVINETESTWFWLEKFENSDGVSVRTLEKTGDNLANLIDEFNLFYSAILETLLELSGHYSDPKNTNIFETSAIIYGLTEGDTINLIADRWNRFYENSVNLFKGGPEAVSFFINKIGMIFNGSKLGEVVTESLEDLEVLLQTTIKFIDNILRKQQGKSIRNRNRREITDMNPIEAAESSLKNSYNELLGQLSDVSQATFEQFQMFKDSGLLKNSRLKTFLETNAAIIGSPDLGKLIDGSLIEIIMKSTITGVELVDQTVKAVHIFISENDKSGFQKVDEILKNLVEGSEIGEIYENIYIVVDDTITLLTTEGDIIDKLLGKENFMINLSEKELLEDSKIEKLKNRVVSLASLSENDLKTVEEQLNDGNDSMAEITSELIETLNAYNVLDFLPNDHQVNATEIEEVLEYVIPEVLRRGSYFWGYFFRSGHLELFFNSHSRAFS